MMVSVLVSIVCLWELWSCWGLVGFGSRAGAGASVALPRSSQRYVGRRMTR